MDPEPPVQTFEASSTTCDLSTICWNCGAAMQPEHAHYRCGSCGWRDSCCDGAY